MARVTVEDCLKHIPNRFNLVILASRRARQLSVGMVEAKLPWENDKPSVMALREIAEGLIDEKLLQQPTAVTATVSSQTVRSEIASMPEDVFKENKATATSNQEDNQLMQASKQEDSNQAQASEQNTTELSDSDDKP